jgi:pyruvate formate-lyase/glycerol dehydratase family glycyl radical enzyme
MTAAAAPTAALRLRVAPLPRLERLRQALLDAPYALCTQKAELVTEYFRATERPGRVLRHLAPLHFRLVRRALARNLGSGVPQARWQSEANRALQRLYIAVDRAAEAPVVRWARALEHVLAHVRLTVYPDELVVGNLSSQRLGAPLHPDFGGLLMLPELERLATRDVNPLATTPEQLRRLRSEILPYWFPRSVLSRAPVLSRDPELQNTLMAGRRFILTQFAGISHVTPDYPSVLERGLTGLLADAEALRARALTPGQRDYAEAAALVCRAGIAFGARWSAHLAGLARAEADPERARELGELAALFERVPAHPARTFHEALQSLFIAHLMVHQESFQHGVSFGRVDQYLSPFYRRDVAAGRLTAEQAVELVGCFLAKASEQLPLFNAMATEYFSGLSSASGLTLGGVDAEGRDASNELTELFLVAYDQMRLRQPNLHLRVHEGTPDPVLDLAHDVLKRGGGMPALFNDGAIVRALEATGVPLADARDYAIVGCVEWGVPYRSFPAAGAAFVSLPAALDRALFGGAEPGSPRRPAPHGSIESVYAALLGELAGVVQAVTDGNDAIERAHARFRPTPLLSVLVRGCTERGVEVNAGGARYNSAGVQGVGLADVADALTAIERLVFREGRVPLDGLLEATEAGFRGHEALLERILTCVPKYGEDEGPPERWARRLAEDFTRLVAGRRTTRGGRYAAGFWAMTTHVGFGRRLPATPNGRLAGQPLADGASPVNGADRRGPTASLMAAARVAHGGVTNGLALNEKLAPWFVEGARGTALMGGLTRGYFASGGMQVQYNVLDPRILLDAKAHPERYRDLVVRISGYSAYFNDLTEAMKDDLIARTLHDAGLPACQLPGRAVP